MKKFTINDFVEYFPVCLNCNKNNKFVILSDLRTERQIVITNDSIVIPLSVNYQNSLNLNFEIQRKTNKFIFSNDKEAIKDYVHDRKFYLRVYCFTCRSFSETSVFDFDFNKDYLKPFQISQEIISIKFNGSNYFVDSNFQSQRTDIEKLTFKSGRAILDFETNVSLYPKYKWKTPEALAKRISKLEKFE